MRIPLFIPSVVSATALCVIVGSAHAQATPAWGDPGVSVSNAFETEDFDQAYGFSGNTLGVDQTGSTLSDFEEAIGFMSNTMGSAPIGAGLGAGGASEYGESQVEDSCSQYDDWAQFLGGVQHRQGLDTAWGETEPTAAFGRELPMCGVLAPVDINNDRRVKNNSDSGHQQPAHPPKHTPAYSSVNGH